MLEVMMTWIADQGSEEASSADAEEGRETSRTTVCPQRGSRYAL